MQPNSLTSHRKPTESRPAAATGATASSTVDGPTHAARSVLRRWSVRSVTLSWLLTSAGVFTVSWERLANIPLGPYNVKLPALLFALAAVTAVPLLADVRSMRFTLQVRLILSGAFALSLLLFARGLLSSRPELAVPQIVAIITGALLPAFAIFLHVALKGRLLRLLTVFVAGGVVAAVYGVYQLMAFYLGLPQGISYTGRGLDGVTGRIAAFSYEPAYFSYFLVLVIGAMVTREVVTGKRAPWWGLSFFVLVIVLANARASLFIVPLFLVLLLIRGRRYRSTLITLGTIAILGGLLAWQMPAIVVAAQRAGAQPSAEPGVTASADAPAASGQPAPSSSPDAVPSPAAPAPRQAMLDPNEASSNAPRLAMVKAVIVVAQDNPLVGVGLGNLGPKMAAAELAPEGVDLSRPVVANDIWLQAVSDGGLLAVLLEALMIGAVAVSLLSERGRIVAPLVCAWLAVLLVGGLLTSFFFDIKIWAVLGLVVGVLALPRAEVMRPTSAGESSGAS